MLTRWGHPGRWTKPGLVLLALLVLALPLLITLHLKHAGENGIRAETNLQSYISEVQIQDGLEWRVISGRLSARDAREKVIASRAHASAHLAQAVGLGLSGDAATAVTTVTRRYDQAVDAEFGLLRSGRQEQALALDQARVDPLFEQVTTTLDQQAVRLSAQAQQAQSLSDVGVLLTVLLPDGDQRDAEPSQTSRGG